MQIGEDTVTGTNILRTNRYSRLSQSGAQALESNDVQASVREGNTGLLTASQASYTAGRTSREDRGVIAQTEVQSAVRNANPMDANSAAVGAAALTSQSGATTSNALRAQLAGEDTQTAIRSALDNPNDAFGATQRGSSLASNVNWPTAYNNWA